MVQWYLPLKYSLLTCSTNVPLSLLNASKIFVAHWGVTKFMRHHVSNWVTLHYMQPRSNMGVKWDLLGGLFFEHKYNLPLQLWVWPNLKYWVTLCSADLTPQKPRTPMPHTLIPRTNALILITLLPQQPHKPLPYYTNNPDAPIPWYQLHDSLYPPTRWLVNTPNTLIPHYPDTPIAW